MLPGMLATAGAGGPPVEGDYEEGWGGGFDDERRAGATVTQPALEHRSTTSTTTSRFKSQPEDRAMEANGFVVPPGQGRVWEMAAGRSSALKLLGGETGESVMMFEETAPAGTQTTYHLHHDSDEVAYVLAGEITFKIGEEVTVGGPGTCAFMPRGLAHAWKNSGAETARVLFLYTPAGAGGFFEESQRLRRSYESLASEEVRAAYRRHRWEIVGPPPF
jgi:quercetin dioxygenase-like cupin family protein